MSERAALNAVKWKVRHKALMLKEFTVATLVRTTGLNADSVRTELQRMRAEKLLVSNRNPRGPRKRGAPQAVYRVPTTEALEKLAASIADFAMAAPRPALDLLPEEELAASSAALAPAPTDEPTSWHFLAARQILDRVEGAGDGPAVELLAEAEHDLERAFHAEGGSLASASVKAHLDYERGRAYYLRAEYERAESSFQAARTYFAGAPQKGVLPQVEEYLLCLELHKKDAPASGRESLLGKLQRLLETLNQSTRRALGPLASMLRETAQGLLEALSTTPAFETGSARTGARRPILDVGNCYVVGAPGRRNSYDLACLNVTPDDSGTGILHAINVSESVPLKEGRQDWQAALAALPALARVEEFGPLSHHDPERWRVGVGSVGAPTPKDWVKMAVTEEVLRCGQAIVLVQGPAAGPPAVCDIGCLKTVQYTLAPAEPASMLLRTTEGGGEKAFAGKSLE